ncbi:MFS general substrate transporter [Penicillium macrosclerotiorum]|uniref:MFS general substrate transporter n=1 Tax=Penicillium macrosclerotiorum TaxID=303699 RepID=UPI0025494638|nr:MFS general substrate transporter [Penicillium macrosclerotiorum]KAJ5689711.1 MFS general substrate transporter [Penicillium macrosclerotiorum]
MSEGKASEAQVEPVESQKPIMDTLDKDPVYSHREQRKIIHHIDARLVLMLGFLHTVSLIDRGNLGTAAVAGMEEELHLHGTQYSTIAVAFFPPYICLQIFGPILVRKIGPINYLSVVVFIWGVVMLSAGFVKNWTELVGIRVIIGALEAGFFPASVYLISTWYTRYDIQKRYAIFYLLGCVASAFTGILSYGITFMVGRVPRLEKVTLTDIYQHGLGGLTAWRWIFIIQGIITCIVATVSYFVLVDFPDRMKGSKRKFLSNNEYDFIMRRITKDRADANLEPFNLKKYLRAGLDVNIWAFGLIYFSTTTTAYAISYFLPIIYQKGMGFSTGASLCLFAPPYAAAGILMYATSWLGDRYHIRGPILVFNAILTIIGLPLMGFTKGNASRLVGAFLTTMGANSNIPAAMAYQANNLRGQWKRAISSAIFVGFGASGGMTGSLIYRSQDSPTYHPGILTCIGLSVTIIVIVTLLSSRFYVLNRKVARGEHVIDGLPGFQYTY